MVLWVKADKWNTKSAFAGFGNNATNQNFQLSAIKGRLNILGWGKNKDWFSDVNINDLNSSKWHCFAITYDGKITKLYVDGIEKDSTNEYTWNTQPRKIMIGQEIDGSGWDFIGAIDEFMILNRALSEKEIEQLYHCLAPKVAPSEGEMKHASSPDNDFKLIVQTKTSFRRTSGTKSPVYVLINGDEKLKRKIPEALRPKALQTFEFDYNYPVDKIKNIKVQIGGSDAWGVSNIAFQVIQGNKKSEMTSVGGGYFSTGRESGARASRSKTYEFKPVLKEEEPESEKKNLDESVLDSGKVSSVTPPSPFKLVLDSITADIISANFAEAEKIVPKGIN